MDNIHTQRQWYEVSSVEFGFYTANEVRKISCRQINNPQVYDSAKNANIGGLYDEALGVSPNDRDTICVTCGKSGLQCSGHSGHIELIVPTYNPIVIDLLLKLLRMNCFQCHRLRIKPRMKEDYKVVFSLVKGGFINEASQFLQIDIGSQLKKIEKLRTKQSKQTKDSKQAKDKKQSNNKEIQLIINKVTSLENRRNYLIQQSNHLSHISQSSVQGFAEFLKIFYGLAQNKCPYCKYQSKAIKKQGANKFFIMNKDHKEGQGGERKKSRDSTSKGDSTHLGTQGQQESSNKRSRKKYLNPKQVMREMKRLWSNQKQLFNIIFGNHYCWNSYSMFFLTVVFVTPSRFRPESKMGEEKYLHDHTSILAKIVQINHDIKMMILHEYMNEVNQKQGQKNKRIKFNDLKQWQLLEIKRSSWYGRVIKKLKLKNQFLNKWLELQDNVNIFMDSTKSSKMNERDLKGIRQILEKKEGLFRMKMMGKRVNYAARSVISPDPSLNTDEVGVPLFMAKKLTFPEHVNEYNLDKLQQYIINGKQYPGAIYLEENGIVTKIDQLNTQERVSIARNLLINHERKIIYRHIMTGDNVLFNRQPTLHKPGLMAHRVKVLPRESTLRMNYANCKSYNADFDGDEMNMHALQNYMCKAEAELCISDNIYTNPTNGKPIRELMQDSILAGVYLTMKNTFLTKKDYTELLYQSTFSLFENKSKSTRLMLLTPAILKPQMLWTGKQLVSNVIKVIVSLSDVKHKNEKGLNMKSTTKISSNYLKGFQQQSEVVLIDNELIKGIIDKNQVGSNSDFGMIHSFNQIYGQKLTGRLLTCLTKLFMNYMQMHGFTCGLDDLQLKVKINKARTSNLQNAMKFTVDSLCHTYKVAQPQKVNYFGRKKYQCDENGVAIEEENDQHQNQTMKPIVQFIEKKIFSDPHATQELDSEYKNHLYEKSSTIINECLSGFIKKFPFNNFTMMTVTGAKGSNVNHSQVSVMLGQQELEGRRVPMMISGKTLPSFVAYDPNPRASGFIGDRFLTGLRQQQFFFHCMAGREGLIDTAVKTSRSGYLQRCLMKHLQSLKVEYDYSVRDADGSIIQFLYGQDCLDPTKQKFFNRMDFLMNNLTTFKNKYQYNAFKEQIKMKQIFKFKKNHSESILSQFPPGPNIATISDKCYDGLVKYNKGIEYNQVMGLKYMHGMVYPGQSVGCTAAQSIGQPSTQMTLNTFHLAGHGGVNLTLGIPRLRQLLMTSSDKIKTPIMQLYFKDSQSKQQAMKFAKKLQKITLLELISNVYVEERKQLFYNDKLLGSADRKRYYKITLQYQEEYIIWNELQLKYKDIEDKIKQTFIIGLLSYINRVKKKNQLRVQIKRVSNVNIDEDNEQDIQDNEDDEQQQLDDGKNKSKKNKKDQSKPQDKQEQVNKFDSPFFQSVNYNKKSCDIVVKVSLSLKKFLMTKVVEKLLKSSIIRQIEGIKSGRVLEKHKKFYIQTQGVNFNILKDLDFIRRQSVTSNDIQAIFRNLGIQAARNAMIKQIVSLFGAYGVSVDYRHLYLIGDYVTFPGKIKAMNRNWIANSASPFQRMSFQTSMRFITHSAVYRETDQCKTPSSRIIMGQPPILGTGMCDIMMDPKFCLN